MIAKLVSAALAKSPSHTKSCFRFDYISAWRVCYLTSAVTDLGVVALPAPKTRLRDAIWRRDANRILQPFCCGFVHPSHGFELRAVTGFPSGLAQST